MKKPGRTAALTAVVLVVSLMLVAAVVGGITVITGSGTPSGGSSTAGPSDPGRVSRGPARGRAPDRGSAVAGDSEAQGAQVGSGEQLGVLPAIRHARPGRPVDGVVSMAVANLPQSRLGGRSRSIRTIAAARPDFIALNEVTGSSAAQLAHAAPGYGAYKDPTTTIHRPGRGNSLENAVLWDSTTWHLVDGARFEYVEHDLVVFKNRRVDWNRYAIWTILRRTSDGAQVVVISTHAMTNPQKDPRTHGAYAWPSRVAQYADGMAKLRRLVAHLSAYGPVLMGGDMNVHPAQGRWSAPDQMALDGFGYTFDGAVMYQFFPTGTRAVGRRLISVDSDHPHALLTSIDLLGRS